MFYFQFDLGCKEWLRALAGTFSSLGTLLVLPLVGFLSDRFGRKITLVVNIFNMALFGLLKAFSLNYTMFLTLQLLQTVLGGGLYTTAYVMGMIIFLSFIDQIYNNLNEMKLK